MTAPANKKRTHNDAAREAKQRIDGGGAKRTRGGRKSPYGRRLEAMKLRKAIRGAFSESPDAVDAGGAPLDADAASMAEAYDAVADATAREADAASSESADADAASDDGPDVASDDSEAPDASRRTAADASGEEE